MPCPRRSWLTAGPRSARSREGGNRTAGRAEHVSASATFGVCVAKAESRGSGSLRSAGATSWRGCSAACCAERSASRLPSSRRVASRAPNYEVAADFDQKLRGGATPGRIGAVFGPKVVVGCTERNSATSTIARALSHGTGRRPGSRSAQGGSPPPIRRSGRPRLLQGRDGSFEVAPVHDPCDEV